MESSFREMCEAAMNLCINTGLIATIIPSTPEEVQENFSQELERLKALFERETQNVQDFAEFYDEE